MHGDVTTVSGLSDTLTRRATLRLQLIYVIIGFNDSFSHKSDMDNRFCQARKLFVWHITLINWLWKLNNNLDNLHHSAPYNSMGKI